MHLFVVFFDYTHEKRLFTIENPLFAPRLYIRGFKNKGKTR